MSHQLSTVPTVLPYYRPVLNFYGDRTASNCYTAWPAVASSRVRADYDDDVLVGVLFDCFESRCAAAHVRLTKSALVSPKELSALRFFLFHSLSRNLFRFSTVAHAFLPRHGSGDCRRHAAPLPHEVKVGLFGCSRRSHQLTIVNCTLYNSMGVH